MAATKGYDLRDAYKIERNFLLLCGIYPNEGRLNNFVYQVSKFYHVSVSMLITLSMVIFIALNFKNVLAIAEALLFLVTQASLICKIFNLLRKKQKLLEIEDILSNPAFYWYSKDKACIVERLVDSTKVLGVIYRITCFLACATYPVIPLMDENEWALPFAGWNPIEVDTRFKFWIVFMFQWMSFCMSGYLNSCIDILIYDLMTVITSQFEVLKDNLTRIRYDLAEAKIEFAKNVLLHYEILRLVDVIDDIFSYGTLLQFFASVIVVCFTGFEMIVVSTNNVQVFSTISYFSCMISQVAMYCWFGNNIIASSDKINEAIYMSNWYESDDSLKKSIMIFMEKCKKPVVLTAGKLFPLSLTTFTSIMRSSYSYFAVLQRLYGPQ